MALYKDGKVYRTLEQQVGHLTEEHDAQVQINEDLENHMQDIDATIAVLPTKEYVDNADALKADKIYVDTELAKKVTKIVDNSGYEKAYTQLNNTINLRKVSSLGDEANVILKTDNNGFIFVKNPTDNANPVNKGTMDTALAGKQSTLTSSSINDGTLDKAIGFDTQGNLVKGVVQGGGGDAFYSIGTFDFITSGGSDIPVILTQQEYEALRDTELPIIALFKFTLMGQYNTQAYIVGTKENIYNNGDVFAMSLFFENKFVQSNNPSTNIDDVFAGMAMEEDGQYYINMSYKQQTYQAFLQSSIVQQGTLQNVLGFDSNGNLKQGSPSVSFPSVSGQYDNALKIPIKNPNGEWKEADPTQIMDFDYAQHSEDTNKPQPIMAYYNEDYSRWEFARAYNTPKLNHYTTEIVANSTTNRKKIYDILKDAKIARISVRESDDDYAAIQGGYIVKGNYLNITFYGVNFATTNVFTYVFSWNNQGTSMESDKYFHSVTTPTSITATRYTASTLNASSIKIYIDYYNDTQLH